MTPFSWHHIMHQKHKKLAEEAGLGNNQKEPRFQPIEPLWTKQFILIAMLNLLAVAGLHIYMSTFPFYILYLGGNEMIIGFTAGGVALLALLVRPLAGWFLDNISRRKLLVWGLITTVFVSVSYLFVPILNFVVIIRCLSGIAFSGLNTATTTVICDTVPKSRFSEGISMFGLTQSLSMAIAPALGLVIMHSMGFTPLFILGTTLPLAGIIIAYKLTFKPAAKEAGLPLRPFTLRNLFNKDALPAAVVGFWGSLPFAGVGAFVALYAQEYGISTGGGYFTLMAIGTCLMRLLCGKVADKHGEGPVIYAGNALMCAAMLLLVWPSSLTFYISAISYGLGIGLAIPALQAMAVRIAPVERRGSASSTFLCGFDLSIALGGPLVGWLVVQSGYTNMFAWMAAFLVVSTLFYGLWAAKSPSAFKNARRNVA